MPPPEAWTVREYVPAVTVESEVIVSTDAVPDDEGVKPFGENPNVIPEMD